MIDLKKQAELGKFIDLLRKKGVTTIEIDGLKMTLAPEAPPSNYKKKQNELQGDVVVENEFSEEAALFWSSAGLPEEKEAV